ncbi:uncharacterized protein LOC124914949 [Impatiens glandulifera]|uniref:uncharacterized protein LOC124914949 n=1 Tax=Impatiens glandulifera TaxID=253017 RepID=UPI001FB0C59A|nr:uncharacterized protein LOC124914949 [Impatiens glandulifera]
MAVVLGNLYLLLDLSSPRVVYPDRKGRLVPYEVVLNLFKKDPNNHITPVNAYPSLAWKRIESDREIHNQRIGIKANSKVNDVDFESWNDDDSNGNGNGYDEEDEENRFDWEKAMRQRVKEMEEMRELEKKAMELQRQMEEEEGDEEGGEETEEEKRMRVRKELEKVAKEQAERRESAELMFDLGQKAYGKGSYGRAIEFLEGALTIIPRSTLFGGEIQIWLAMAYEANNRHRDCISLYQQLEKTHPSLSIRRQAAELRYILQAPKLKITQEEMVTIPLIGSSYDSYAGTWSDKNKDKDEKKYQSTTNQLSSSRDFLGDFMVWRPPADLGKNSAFWLALTLWIGLVGVALILQR